MRDCAGWEGAGGGEGGEGGEGTWRKHLPQERRNSAMQDCTGWEGAGGRGGTCHTSCSIFHKRGETAPCEITLVGRGQEAEEGRFFIIVATIILSDLN